MTGRRRAIVHIGLPRTGTTTLQRVLFDRQSQLLAAGVLYPTLTPRSAAEPHLNHQHLGEALDGRRSKAECAELCAELAGQLTKTPAEVVLLSYEGLCLSPAWLGVPRQLARLFARHGFAMEVLLTVKPQDELVNSAYTWRTQFLREARPFADYFQAEIGSARLDLQRVLRPWRRACEGRALAVPTRAAGSDRPLVERIFTELDILPRVAAAIDADDLAVVENRSPGPIAVEVARRLRQGGAQVALGANARAATRFVEDAARERGLNDVPFTGLDAPMRATAATRWAAANDRFAQEVWGADWASHVAPQPARPSNREVDLAQVDDILRDVCAHYRIQLQTGPKMAFGDALAAVGRRLAGVRRYGRAMGL